MTNSVGPFGANRRLTFPEPPKGEVIATFDTYQLALDAVDRLAHADFPVRGASIVGNDLKSVERVTGRLSWGRAAGAGAISGLWLGLFLGFVTLIFSSRTSPGFLIGAVLIGAAFGMLFGLASYAATRRLRDFSSVMQMVATSYSVLVPDETANRAKNLLASAQPTAAAARVDDPPAGPLA